MYDKTVTDEIYSRPDIFKRTHQQKPASGKWIPLLRRTIRLTGNDRAATTALSQLMNYTDNNRSVEVPTR